MDKTWQACTELALRQHGIISLDQALALGVSPDAFKRRVASGLFERVLPSVYRLVAVPVTPRQRLVAACLWGPDGTAASHSSAAALLRLPDMELRQIHVITAKTTHRLPSWVTAHRMTSTIPGLWSVDGIPLTPPWVTLIDLGSLEKPAVVGRCLDHALRRRLVSLPQMRWALEAFGRSCHRGTAVMRGLLKARGPGYEPPQSTLEERFLALVDDSDLPPGVRQFRIWDGTRYRYFDLAYPEQHLAIELDGWETHGTRKAFQDDRERDRATQLLGWLVLRFTWDDVEHQPEKVLADIRRGLFQKVL